MAAPWCGRRPDGWRAWRPAPATTAAASPGAADLTPKCPVICHFGRKDGYIPADEVKAKLAERPACSVPVYIYEKSGHGFNNDGRPDSDAGDAKLARERTLALFEANGAR